jgi:hypothetical protein
MYFLRWIFIDFIYSSLCFDLRSLEGVSICIRRTELVESFGGTSLAWASMGLEPHRLDVVRTSQCTFLPILFSIIIPFITCI